MHKKFIAAWLICFVLVFVVGFHVELGGTASGSEIIDEHTFVDDVGNLIEFDEPYQTIVSLDSIHTENLYAIGAGDLIEGVDTKSTFPIDVNSLPKFTFTEDSDIERLIKLNPDLILITPYINSKHASFVTRLETAGLKVVSLEPDDFNEFPIYIQKLGLLTGESDNAETALKTFDNDLQRIADRASQVEEKKSVFIESSELGYLTPSRDTLPYLALENINADNIAEPELSKYPDGEMNTYGLDQILENKDQIDVYLTIVGGIDGGADIVSIKQKEAFKDIPAIENNKVFEMEHSLIDEYSFRYVLGNLEMARAVYPEVFDDVSDFKNDEALTRANFSEIVVKMLHAPIYINTDASYYDYDRYNHLYGSYEDVPWQDDQFDYIETASSRLYIKAESKVDKVETFDKEGLITKADVANFFYILYNLGDSDTHQTISDIAGRDDERIIQRVVDANLLALEDGYFNPDQTYTNNEFISLMEKTLQQNTIDLIEEIQ